MITSPNIDFQNDAIFDDGVIRRENIEDYSVAVNQLLVETGKQFISDKSQREEEPSSTVLVAMKSIIACSLAAGRRVRAKCLRLSKQDTKDIAACKQQLLLALTNQMLASRRAAVDGPSDEVKSELESALMALTSVVVEMYHLMRDISLGRGMWVASPASTARTPSPVHRCKGLGNELPAVQRPQHLPSLKFSNTC